MEFKDSKDFSLLFFVWAFIKSLEKIIEKRFCSKCWGNNNKLWFSGIYWKSNYKSLVDLFKGRGCGQSPQILSAYAI
jgi:hypothetical protein